MFFLRGELRRLRLTACAVDDYVEATSEGGGEEVGRRLGGLQQLNQLVVLPDEMLERSLIHPVVMLRQDERPGAHPGGNPVGDTFPRAPAVGVLR